MLKIINKKITEKSIIIKTLILIVITVIIITFLFSKISFKEVFKIMISSNPCYISFALIISILITTLIAYRWHYISSKFGNHKFKDSYIAVMSSFPLNSFLPSKLGDFFKAYYLKKYGFTKMIGAIFTERLFDILVMLLFLLLSSILINEMRFLKLSIILLLLISLLITILIIKPIKIKYKIVDHLLTSLKWISRRPKESVVFFSISIGLWIISIIQVYLIFLALDINCNFIYFSSAFVVIIFIGMIPITIAGMGTREAAIIFLFAQYASNEQLLAAGLLFSFFRYWLLSLIGTPFLYYAIKK